MGQLRIILVETAGPLNLGSVARVMKNMGLSELVLVSPKCDRNSPEARSMAVHADDILAKARIVPDLPAALNGCVRAAATTSVPRRTSSPPLELPQDVLPWLIELDQPCALIFGREDHGLNNLELNYAQRCFALPTDSAYPSLNLAQAVAICCHEVYKLRQTNHLGSQNQESSQNLATLDALERYYQQLEEMLLQIGYLYPHTATARMSKFRHLFNRISLTNEELAMLQGIISQVNWAIAQNHPKP